MHGSLQDKYQAASFASIAILIPTEQDLTQHSVKPVFLRPLRHVENSFNKPITIAAAGA